MSAVTTMVLGNERFGCTAQVRWRAALLHGGILAALVAGLVSLWIVVALVAALLAHPGPTMTTLEREGARGVPKVVRQGTVTLVSELRGRVTGRSGR